MKMKRLLAFLMSGLVMLSCTACSEDDNTKKDSKPDATISETDTSDKQDSDSTEDSGSEPMTDIITAPFDNANATSKVICIAANKYTERCFSAGYHVTKTDGDCTGLLVIGESDNPRRVPTNDNETLTQETIEYLSNEVNYELKENGHSLQGTVYCIFYNGRGLPIEIYWAEDETSEIVGKYPSDDTYAYTEGGIKSIIENGPDAFGNKPLV